MSRVNRNSIPLRYRSRKLQRTLSTVVLVLLTPLLPAYACGNYFSLDSLVEEALTDPSPATSYTIQSLRGLGPIAVETLLPAALEKAALQEADRRDSSGPLEILDRVCGMKDCASSQLFWHTDLNEALRLAQSKNLPVLSLRLLGRLDEDLSCANSRFFRTALYPDPAVGELLREKFVLHWQSVRPAPRVVVDYGDGRKLEGTLTGNSIHYVLDSQGRVIDALPGLYDPETFLSELRSAELSALRAAQLSEQEFAPWLRSLHLRKRSELDTALLEDLRKLGQEARFNTLMGELEELASDRSTAAFPNAQQAALRAMSKAMSEAPILSRISKTRAPAKPLPGHDIWPLIAEQHRPNVHLSENSRRLLRAKHGLGNGDVDHTFVESTLIENPAIENTVVKNTVVEKTVIENFEQSLALDTVLNQQLWHRTLHTWIALAERPQDLKTLNEAIYRDLFLSPLDDPWLGLAPREIYTGLEMPAPPVESGQQAVLLGP